MTYTRQNFSKFQNSALTHDDNNVKDAMLGDVITITIANSRILSVVRTTYVL